MEENMIINESRNTPEVILDTDKKYFSLRGVSYPENAQKFYEPIFDMAKKYLEKKQIKNEITMEVDFDYFNTSTARMLYQIFRLFNNAAEGEDLGVNIVWLYESDDMDMIELFNLSGSHTNVNSLPPGNLNSVNPCQYIYGCTDPCFIEYYNVVEYNSQEDFNFSFINNILNNNGCDFEYNYGCTEILIPNPQPTFDDGSCTNLLVYGCMDPDAANYNPNATINDCTSCISSIEIDFTVNNPDCYSDLSGDFSWTISGGVPPYQFVLYNDMGDVVEEMILQENIENILNLELGDYFIEVTDFLNYNNSVSFSILESSDFVIDLWESGGWLITNSGYDNYEWTLNGNILLDIDPNTYQISPSLSGLYGVTATYDYNNGTCISNTAFENFIVFQSSLDESQNLLVTCVPNPSMGQVVLTINESHLEPVYCDFFDSFGKQLWLKPKRLFEKKSLTIENIPAGIYYFRVKTLDIVQVIPMIVIN